MFSSSTWESVRKGFVSWSQGSNIGEDSNKRIECAVCGGCWPSEAKFVAHLKPWHGIGLEEYMEKQVRSLINLLYKSSCCCF